MTAPLLFPQRCLRCGRWIIPQRHPRLSPRPRRRYMPGYADVLATAGKLQRNPATGKIKRNASTGKLRKNTASITTCCCAAPVFSCICSSGSHPATITATVTAITSCGCDGGTGMRAAAPNGIYTLTFLSGTATTCIYQLKTSGGAWIVQYIEATCLTVLSTLTKLAVTAQFGKSGGLNINELVIEAYEAADESDKVLLYDSGIRIGGCTTGPGQTVFPCGNNDGTLLYGGGHVLSV